MAIDRLCVMLQPVNYGISQWVNFNFNSFCQFNGVTLGSNEDGIYILDGADDAGTDINASFTLGPSNLGEDQDLKLRRLSMTGEFEGNLILTISQGETGEIEYTLEPKAVNMTQTSVQKTLTMTVKNRVWTFEIQNVDGCDFSIDLIEVLVALLARLVR